MEKKINFETSISYDLPLNELKTMYIYIALAKCGNLRNPDYDEVRLLKALRGSFKRFLTDTLSLMEQMPNDHSLHKIVAFFDFHYNNLKRITEELEKTSE